MQRLRLITKPPHAADSIAPEVKLTFLRDILDAAIDDDVIEGTFYRDFVNVAIPLFINKDPSNPLPPGEEED
jgi:hypothetical protein